MKWPADRKFTDKDGKILDHWRGPMGVLEPLLALSPQQITALLTMIGAYLNPDEGTDPGTAINLALPIDTEPLPDEDWLIEYKNSASAGRRVPISTLLAMVPASKVLISTTSLAGLSTTTIPIPAGYTDIEIYINGLSLSALTVPLLAYSEDGGSTTVDQPGATSTSSADGRNTTNYSSIVPTNMAAADILWAVVRVRNYTSNTTKLALLDGSYAGEYVHKGTNLQSTQPLNAAVFTTGAGTFDLGDVELWGIP